MVDIDFHNLAPVVPGGLFQSLTPAIYTYVTIYMHVHAKLVIGPGQMGNVGPISNFTISILFTKGPLCLYQGE